MQFIIFASVLPQSLLKVIYCIMVLKNYFNMNKNHKKRENA